MMDVMAGVVNHLSSCLEDGGHGESVRKCSQREIQLSVDDQLVIRNDEGRMAVLQSIFLETPLRLDSGPTKQSKQHRCAP